jgi:hypothetical protein
MHTLKIGLKHASLLARKGARAALPLLKASAPLVIEVAVTVVPAGRAVRMTQVLQAKQRAK